VTFANITLQSSILSSDMVGRAQIRWKDILRFEHVKVRHTCHCLPDFQRVVPDI
jgi:hypothetical protein